MSHLRESETVYCGHHGELIDGRCIRCIASERDDLLHALNLTSDHGAALQRLAVKERDRYREALEQIAGLEHTTWPIQVARNALEGKK